MSLNKNSPYLPLAATTETRIILLAPGKTDDPIHCSLLTIDLDYDSRLSDESCQLQPCSTGQPTPSQEASPQHENAGSGFNVLGPQNRPASRSSPLVFKRYAALSYVWGDQSNPHEIFLDGKPFFVGENLYFALLHLRQSVAILGLGNTTSGGSHDQKFDAIQHHMSLEGRYLWIDAICINQNDVAEREAQVKLMARIYQQADHVHGHLGRKEMTGGVELLYLLQRIMIAGGRCESKPSRPEESSQQESCISSDATIKITSALVSEFGNFQAGKSENIQRDRLPNPSSKVIEEQGIPPEDDILWAHWRQFLNSPYFQRLWVLQESSLAKTITLWYSNVSIELELVYQCIQYLVEYSTNPTFYLLSREEHDPARRSLSDIWAVFGLFLQRRRMQGVDKRVTKKDLLLDMLDIGRRAKATDPRDKIFGLLGMAADGSDFLHLVTYSRSVETVYQDFAKSFIERGWGIAMLCQVDSRVSKSLDIPSWVPDWSRCKDEEILHQAISSSFGASNEQQAVDIRLSGSTLAIKGHIIDTVELLSTSISTKSTYTTFTDIAAFLWGGGNLLVNQNIKGDEAVEIMLQTLRCGTLHVKPAAEVDKLRQGFTAVFGHGMYLANGGKSEDSPWLPHMRHFIVSGMALTSGRRWCTTKTGRFGLVPGGTKQGDRIALFGNYPLPFLLRQCSTQAGVSCQNRDKTIHQEAPTSTETSNTLVGHGYINELNITKIQSSNDRSARDILLV